MFSPSFNGTMIIIIDSILNEAQSQKYKKFFQNFMAIIYSSQFIYKINICWMHILWMQIFIIIGLNKVTAFLHGFKIIDVNCWLKLISRPVEESSEQVAGSGEPSTLRFLLPASSYTSIRRGNQSPKSRYALIFLDVSGEIRLFSIRSSILVIFPCNSLYFSIPGTSPCLK
jgi:hypothetical protein